MLSWSKYRAGNCSLCQTSVFIAVTRSSLTCWDGRFKVLIQSFIGEGKRWVVVRLKVFFFFFLKKTKNIWDISRWLARGCWEVIFHSVLLVYLSVKADRAVWFSRRKGSFFSHLNAMQKNFFYIPRIQFFTASEGSHRGKMHMNINKINS